MRLKLVFLLVTIFLLSSCSATLRGSLTRYCKEKTTHPAMNFGIYPIIKTVDPKGSIEIDESVSSTEYFHPDIMESITNSVSDTSSSSPVNTKDLGTGLDILLIKDGLSKLEKSKSTLEERKSTLKERKSKLEKRWLELNNPDNPMSEEDRSKLTSDLQSISIKLEGKEKKLKEKEKKLNKKEIKYKNMETFYKSLLSNSYNIPWKEDVADISKISVTFREELLKELEVIGDRARLELAQVKSGSLSKWNDYVDKEKKGEVILERFSNERYEVYSSINKSVTRGGFRALAIDRIGKLYNLHREMKNSEKNSNAKKIKEYRKNIVLEANELNAANYIVTYMKAYARGGNFYQIILKNNDIKNTVSNKIKTVLEEKGKENTEKLSEKLQNLVTDRNLKQTIDKIVKEMSKNGREIVSETFNEKFGVFLDSICKKNEDVKSEEACMLSKKLGDQAFVTRYGMSVQFAGISVLIGKDGEHLLAIETPESTEFGPEIARVFTEAIMDSHGVIVPAVMNSTACKEGLLKKNRHCLGADDENFQDILKIDELAAKVEAPLTASAAKVLRGLSWGGLNNDALANSLATLVGVTGRKLATKGVYYIYIETGGCLPPVGIDMHTTTP